MSKKSDKENLETLEKSLEYAKQTGLSEDFWTKLPERIKAENALASEIEKRGEPGPEVFSQRFTL